MHAAAATSVMSATQNDSLGQPIVSADPFRCRVWKLHDRFQSEITVETCRAEIESFASCGQIVPVLGRRIENDPQYDIELAYGARRLFAARQLNKPLLVQLREFSDREGLVAMDIENRQRQDISPYERGLSYKRWLQSRQFGSQGEMARLLCVSASQISRLLQLARLPAVVVDAFRDPTEIRENWGLKLVEALDDPTRRADTIRAARVLGNCTPRPQGPDVMRKLLSRSNRGRKPRKEPHDRVVLGQQGSALFRIRFLSDAVALMFSTDLFPAPMFNRIEKVLADLLQDPLEGDLQPAPVLRADLRRNSPAAPREANARLTL
ncbi:MAG TPA: ParB/RepB/Spo0J family partition protein [Steroidobacteraceae bacterium]|nr:ParB/RepB/Spo0J family partition protein [Steroidobacteraceae bacterium]